MNHQTPARLYALVIGATLVVAGIIGFFYSAEFTDDKAVRDAVFGILDVNGWHNFLHIATGALGLLAFSGDARTARLYALGRRATPHDSSPAARIRRGRAARTTAPRT